MKQLRSLLPLALFAVVFATPGLSDSQLRVRGTIEKLDGPTLVVKERDGSELRVKPAPDATVLGIERTSIADVKPGSFIGAAAVPAANGNLRALEVTVFPENMRGTGEGHTPFDLQPKSSMTNATVVEAQATGNDSKMLTVKYKGGEQKIIVGEHTPVVAFVPGDKSDLKPGVRIIAFNATRDPDGTVEAPRLGYGKNGLTPPM